MDLPIGEVAVQYHDHAREPRDEAARRSSALHCNPELLANFVDYLTERSRATSARSWAQLAFDMLANGRPDRAAVGACTGWWTSCRAGVGLSIAFNSAPTGGDVRCAEVAQAGMALGPVAHAAFVGYERATPCAECS